MVYGILSSLSIPVSMRAEYPSSNVSLSEKTSSCKRDFVFIVNPKGANGRTEREWVKLLPYLHTRLGSQCNICVSFTSRPTHATDITRKAIREGAGAVIAVGGDGTIHEVVNGFFGLGENVLVQDVRSSHTTTLGFIPLGTGSDFIRTLGWKNNPKEVIDHIAKGLKLQVDVGVISGDKYSPHYFINVADIHLSAKAGYHAGKFKTCGNLCYVFGSLRAFMGHHDRDLRIKINGGDWMICKSVTTLCIANAKYFGGGMKIAPNAYPWSGDLEVVIFQNFKWYDFLLKLHKLYRGTHLSEKNVSSRRVHTIEVEEIEPSGNIYVQSDGEHLGFLPSKISILPSAIEMFI